MTESMKTFLAKVSEDKRLAEKAGKLEKAELIALAKELGIDSSPSGAGIYSSMVSRSG